jgi:hypothetical protein
MNGRKAPPRLCRRAVGELDAPRPGCAQAAIFLIAVYEGYVVLAKNAQDGSVWKAGIRNIVGCLQSLRPSNKRVRLS